MPELPHIPTYAPNCNVGVPILLHFIHVHIIILHLALAAPYPKFFFTNFFVPTHARAHTHTSRIHKTAGSYTHV